VCGRPSVTNNKILTKYYDCSHKTRYLINVGPFEYNIINIYLCRDLDTGTLCAGANLEII